MRHGIADPQRKGEEKDNTDGVECNAKDDISNDPSIVECTNDEDELRDNVNDDANSREDQIGHKETDGVVVLERSDVAEGSNGDKKADASDDEGAQTKELMSENFERVCEQLTQRDIGVPSSTKLNPTIPFTSRHQ